MYSRNAHRWRFSNKAGAWLEGTPDHGMNDKHIIVFICLVVYIYYCVFNVFKLQLFHLLIHVHVFLYIFHCILKLFQFYL